MKRFLVISLLAVAFFLPGVAAANLILNGDFNTQPPIINQPYISGGAYDGAWLGNDKWTVSPTGGVGDSPYAHHASEGNRLYQGFEVSIAPGTLMNISLDYIYQTGIISSEVWIHVYGLDAGEGMGTFNNFIGSPDLLFSEPIAIKTDWFHFTDSFTVGGDYDSLLFVVMYNAFGTNTSGLRGVDDVNIDVAPVPEASSILLLGSGLVGLIGYRRMRRMM